MHPETEPDDIHPEYSLDYRQARPNRFAPEGKSAVAVETRGTVDANAAESESLTQPGEVYAPGEA